MAETYKLDAQTRTVTGKKVSQIRNQGLVPAVIYGNKVQPTHLQVPYRELERTLFKAGGTHLIDVNVSGTTQTVLARSVQRDVIRGTIIHVDFFAVDQSVTIRTEVPIHFVGESPAVSGRIGVLQNSMNSLQLEALPADLIDSVTVDVSVLKQYGDAIYIRDLNLPSGVVALIDADTVIVRVVGARVEEVTDEVAEEEAGSAEPELVERKRGEDEE